MAAVLALALLPVELPMAAEPAAVPFVELGDEGLVIEAGEPLRAVVEWRDRLGQDWLLLVLERPLPGLGERIRAVPGKRVGAAEVWERDGRTALAIELRAARLDYRLETTTRGLKLSFTSPGPD